MIYRPLIWFAFACWALAPTEGQCGPLHRQYRGKVQSPYYLPAPELLPPYSATPVLPQVARVVQNFDVNVIAAQIQEVMATNPNLFGAWLYFTFDDPDPGVTPGKFTFWRVLDTSRAELQKQELGGFISKWVPGGNYRVDEKRDRYFPFSSLIGQLQDLVDSSPELAGAMVLGAHYSPNPNADDKIDLMLHGRVAVEEQMIEIEKRAARLMRAEPAWVQPGRVPRAQNAVPSAEALSTVPLQITPDISGLQVVRGSGEAARTLFFNGLQKYWSGDYAGASRDFQFASLESPRAIEYRYWRVVADLSSGNSERAYRQMKNVIRLYGIDLQSHKYRDVGRSLARVQGPLRSELSRLELRAVMDVMASGGRSAVVAPKASVTMRPTRW